MWYLGGGVRCALICAYCAFDDAAPPVQEFLLKWHLKKGGIVRYVAKYCSNWQGTLSCCQSSSKKHCCSHRDWSTAWCFLLMLELWYMCLHCASIREHQHKTHTYIISNSHTEGLLKYPETLPTLFKNMIIRLLSGNCCQKSLPSII